MQRSYIGGTGMGNIREFFIFLKMGEIITVKDLESGPCLKSPSDN